LKELDFIKLSFTLIVAVVFSILLRPFIFFVISFSLHALSSKPALFRLGLACLAIFDITDYPILAFAFRGEVHYLNFC